MSNLDDFEIEKSDRPAPRLAPPESGGPPVMLGVALAVVVLVVGAAVYLAFRKQATPAPSPSPAAAPATEAPSPAPTLPLGMPALDASDGFVRELAKGLFGDPGAAAWLAAQGLVRAFVGSVENVAAGESPRAHLPFLAPKGSFAVARQRGRLVIDRSSYARYDAIAAIAASLDAAAAADVYRKVGPLLDAAYRELGHPEPFSQGLARAAAVLLATPVVPGQVRVRAVRRATLVYEMEDARLEGLLPAQKHLLRMGPDNERKVQAKLKELAGALGLELPRLEQ